MHIDPETGALHLGEDYLPIMPHIGKAELQKIIGSTKTVSDIYPPRLSINDGTDPLVITFVLEGERFKGLQIEISSGRANQPEVYAALAKRLGLAGSPAWGGFGHRFAHSGTDYEEYLQIYYREPAG